MRAGGWWTLAELAEVIGCSEAAASARVRDLRKAIHGAHKVLCRRTGPGNLHKYRLILTREESNCEASR
jgi:DNA-binding Lrp family transcriptional regulator